MSFGQDFGPVILCSEAAHGTDNAHENGGRAVIANVDGTPRQRLKSSFNC